MTAAATGLLAASPALAQLIGGSGGVGGVVGVGGPGVGVGTATTGNVGVRVPRVDTNVGVDARTDVRVQRRHRVRHRGHHHHDRGGAFVGAGVDGGLGLHTGMLVRDNFGANVGTISRINTSNDGTVRSVLISRADGSGSVRLAPNRINVHSSGRFAITGAIRAHRGG
ncbi:MAG: hypothetical protein ACT4OE_08525 [Sphingosinicella sp.]